MAIVLKSKKYNLNIDSKIIIGLLGDNIDSFLNSFRGNNVLYASNILLNTIDINKEKYEEYYELLDIDKVMNKSIKELSHSEKKLLQYFLMIQSNSKIIIINEPYLDLDYSEKKKINIVFNKLIKEGKTIIIGSHDTNVVYSLCKKVLLVSDNEIVYDNVNCLTNKDILNKYHLIMPDIVKFVALAKEKGVKISYTKDIRDLIKDVYRNVSKR